MQNGIRTQREALKLQQYEASLDHLSTLAPMGNVANCRTDTAAD